MRQHGDYQKRPQPERQSAVPLQKLWNLWCAQSGVLDPEPSGYSEEEKRKILRAYRERGSMRAVERIFGVSRNTLSRWLKKRDTRPTL